MTTYYLLAYDLRPTTYNLRPTTYYLRSTTYYLLPTTYLPLLLLTNVLQLLLLRPTTTTTNYLLPTTYYLDYDYYSTTNDYYDYN